MFTIIFFLMKLNGIPIMILCLIPWTQNLYFLFLISLLRKFMIMIVMI